MSTLRIFLSIMFLSLFFIPLPTTGISVVKTRPGALWDMVSFIMVFGSTLFFYAATANKKSYLTKQSLNIKLNFIKEMFIINAMIGTSVGLCFMWFGTTKPMPEGLNDGQLWVRLGASMGVALLTDGYGSIGYFSTTVYQYFMDKKRDLDDKVFKIYKSYKSISLSFFVIPFLFIGLAYSLCFSASGTTFNEYWSIYKNIIIVLFLILTMLSILIVGPNFKTVLNSFLNKNPNLSSVNETIDDLRKLSRTISILMGTSILFGMVHCSLVFYLYTPQSLGLPFSQIFLVFNLSLIFVSVIRTFLFRLNLCLLENNQALIDVDKYYIFKYIIPVYIVLHVISALGFFITIFK